LANCATNYLTIVCRAPELVDVGSDCNGTTYMGESTQSDNSLEYTFNQTLRDENTKAKAQLRSFFQNIFSRLDLTRSYESIFSMLWYSTIPCFDVESITSSGIASTRVFLQKHKFMWDFIFRSRRTWFFTYLYMERNRLALFCSVYTVPHRHCKLHFYKLTSETLTFKLIWPKGYVLQFQYASSWWDF